MFGVARVFRDTVDKVSSFGTSVATGDFKSATEDVIGIAHTTVKAPINITDNAFQEVGVDFTPVGDVAYQLVETPYDVAKTVSNNSIDFAQNMARGDLEQAGQSFYDLNVDPFKETLKGSAEAAQAGGTDLETVGNFGGMIAGAVFYGDPVSGGALGQALGTLGDKLANGEDVTPAELLETSMLGAGAYVAGPAGITLIQSLRDGSINSSAAQDIIVQQFGGEEYGQFVKPAFDFIAKGDIDQQTALRFFTEQLAGKEYARLASQMIQVSSDGSIDQNDLQAVVSAQIEGQEKAILLNSALEVAATGQVDTQEIQHLISQQLGDSTDIEAANFVLNALENGSLDYEAGKQLILNQVENQYNSEAFDTLAQSIKDGNLSAEDASKFLGEQLGDEGYGEIGSNILKLIQNYDLSTEDAQSLFLNQVESLQEKEIVDSILQSITDSSLDSSNLEDLLIYQFGEEFTQNNLELFESISSEEGLHDLDAVKCTIFEQLNDRSYDQLDEQIREISESNNIENSLFDNLLDKQSELSSDDGIESVLTDRNPVIDLNAEITDSNDIEIDTIHSVEQGDSLWDLAEKYYEDGSKWTVIHNSNQDLIEDPNLIHPEQNLYIPDTHANSDNDEDFSFGSVDNSDFDSFDNSSDEMEMSDALDMFPEEQGCFFVEREELG